MVRSLRVYGFMENNEVILLFEREVNANQIFGLRRKQWEPTGPLAPNFGRV